MSVPGSNLLAQALTLIAAQTVGYMRWVGNAPTFDGGAVPAYAPSVPKRGSFQAVQQEFYSRLGLDFEKEYAMWYDPKGETRSIDRDRGADLLSYGGFIWEAVRDTDWKNQDQWKGVLFAKLRPAS